MKKVILILFMIPLLWACSKEEENYPLANYAWSYENETEYIKVTYILLLDYDNHCSYNSFIEDKYLSDQDEEKYKKGTYTYNHPKLVFTSDIGFTKVFTVSDDKEYITDEQGRRYNNISK